MRWSRHTIAARVRCQVAFSPTDAPKPESNPIVAEAGLKGSGRLLLDRGLLSSRAGIALSTPNPQLPALVIGEVAEWSIAAVLKTAGPQGPGGSNPSLSASFGRPVTAEVGGQRRTKRTLRANRGSPGTVRPTFGLSEGFAQRRRNSVITYRISATDLCDSAPLRETSETVRGSRSTSIPAGGEEVEQVQ